MLFLTYFQYHKSTFFFFFFTHYDGTFITNYFYVIKTHEALCKMLRVDKQ